MAADRQAVSFVNRALALLGEEPITALLSTESSTAAVAVSLYEPTKEMLLGCWPWKFATKRKALNRLTDTPTDEWNYQFSMPSDFLLLHRTDVAAGSWAMQADQAGTDEGQLRMYSDHSAVTIEYTADLDEAYFPNYFQEALVMELAARMAAPISERADLVQLYQAQAREALSKAKAIDYNQEPARLIDDDAGLVSQRFSGWDWS